MPPNMQFRGQQVQLYRCFLAVLLFVTGLLLLLSTTSLILSIRSQYHTGLDPSLCKCELFHGQKGRSISPRIVNGTEFNGRGLSWLASIYLELPPFPKNFSIVIPNTTSETTSPDDETSSLLDETSSPDDETFLASDETSSPYENVVRFQHLCTGSILNERIILTASHCFENAPFPISRLWVAAGADHNQNSIFCRDFIPDRKAGQPVCNLLSYKNHTKKVLKIHMHPRYTTIVSLLSPGPNDTMSDALASLGDLKDVLKSQALFAQNDLALVETQPFILSEELNILPGCLFESDDRSFGDRLLAAGYGWTREFYDTNDPFNITITNQTIGGRSKILPGLWEPGIELWKPEVKIMYKELHKLHTTQLRQAGCETMMTEKELKKGRPPIICASAPFSTTCKGDSGGPLLFSKDGRKQFIVGTLHGGDLKNGSLNLCEVDTLSTYAPVYEQLDWIRSLVGDERCITKTFQFEPAKFWPYVQAITLSVLSISLIVVLIQKELRNSTTGNSA